MARHRGLYYNVHRIFVELLYCGIVVQKVANYIIETREIKGWFLTLVSKLIDLQAE